MSSLVARTLWAIRAPKSTYPQWALAQAESMKWGMPDLRLPEAQAELYQRLSWVHIAVRTIADAAAVQPLAVKRLQGEDTEDIDAHPFEELLRRPNPLQSRSELLYATVAYRALTGNAYWWINRPSQNAPPDELWLIPSHQIKPIPDGRLYLSHYEYDVGLREPLRLPVEMICHFKTYHPTNPFVGLSPIEALATVAIGDMAAQKWNSNFFAKDHAKAAGALAFSDPIPDSEWERLKAEFRRDYGGTERQLMMLRNAGTGGVQWVQMAANQDDMQFLEGRQFTKEEVWQAFGLPPGMWDKNATEANATASKAAFSEYTLHPTLTAIAETITNTILPAYGDKLVAEFEDPRKADRAQDLAELQAYAQVHTVNEIRTEHYGDDALPDDDPRGDMMVVELAPGVAHSKREQEEARQQMAEAMQGGGDDEPPTSDDTATAQESEPTEEPAAKGGPGSGNWGHAGRPGSRGGSMPRGVAMSVATGRDAAERQAAARERGRSGGIAASGWGELDNSGEPATEKQAAYAADLLRTAAEPLYLQSRASDETAEEREFYEAQARAVTQSQTADGLRIMQTSRTSDADRAGLDTVHQRAQTWARDAAEHTSELSKRSASIIIDGVQTATPGSLVRTWANVHSDGTPQGVADLVNSVTGTNLLEYVPDSPFARSMPLMFHDVVEAQRARRAAREGKALFDFSELRRWRDKTRKRGKPTDWEPEALPTDLVTAIKAVQEHVPTPVAAFRFLKAIEDSRMDAEGELADALGDMLGEWLGRFIRAITGKADMPWAEFEAALNKALLPQIVAAMTEEVLRQSVAVGVGLEVGTVNVAALDWARTYTYDLIKGLTDTTRKTVQGAVTSFLETPGMTRGDLEKLLSTAFSESRASAIAVTEVTRASSQAAAWYQQELAKSGLTMNRRWYTLADERVCPICGPLHGQLESVWAARFPDGPPAHPNCRCSVVLTADTE